MATAEQTSWLTDISKNLHFASVRIDANHGYYESTQGSINWSALDGAVSAAHAAGLSVHLIVDGTPPWAAANPSLVTSDNDFANYASPAVFGTWAGELATRYGGNGTTFETWNEPNIKQFWQDGPNATNYFAMHLAAYNAIKAVNSSYLVGSAGLAPATDDSAGDIAPVEFLTDLYNLGLKSCSDYIGWHPYSFPALPNTEEAWSGWSQMSATSPSARSVMAANGDSAKQIWATEVGWDSGTAEQSGIAGPTAEADEATQMAAFAKANSWLGRIYWFEYMDFPNNGGLFGVVNASGNKKAAYAAVAAATL
jgi:hypothetical protein